MLVYFILCRRFNALQEWVSRAWDPISPCGPSHSARSVAGSIESTHMQKSAISSGPISCDRTWDKRSRIFAAAPSCLSLCLGAIPDLMGPTYCENEMSKWWHILGTYMRPENHEAANRASALRCSKSLARTVGSPGSSRNTLRS